MVPWEGVYLINLRKLLGERVINLFSPAEGTPLPPPPTTSTLTSKSCAVLGLGFLNSSNTAPILTFTARTEKGK